MKSCPGRLNILIFRVVFLIIIPLFAVSGCGKGSTVVLIPDPDGNVGKLVVSNGSGERELKGENDSVQVNGRTAAPGTIKKMGREEIEKAFAEVLAAEPDAPARFILYFLQNSNDLTDESEAEIPKIMDTIKRRSAKEIVISGHTDTKGSMEYNYKLSLERAKKMEEILVKNGADSEDITVTSHGEGNPIIKTADEVDEPRNRRVEVVVK